MANMTESDSVPFDPDFYIGDYCGFCNRDYQYYPPYQEDDGSIFCSKCHATVEYFERTNLVAACRGLLDDIKNLEEKLTNADWWRRSVPSLVNFRHHILRIEELLAASSGEDVQGEARAELREACKELLEDLATLEQRQEDRNWWWSHCSSGARNYTLVEDVIHNER